MKELKLSETIINVVKRGAEAGEREAAELFADSCRDNLREHDSELTGTGELRSAKAQEIRARYGPTLSEQVITYKAKDGGRAAAPTSRVSWIAWFLEHDRDHSLWGKANTTRAATPWMRTAYAQTRDRATRVFAEEMERSVNG